MKTLFITFLILLLSCNSKEQREKYADIVSKTDRISIFFKQENKTLELSPEQIKNFKNILTRNIEIEYMKKFHSDIQIELYR